MSVDLSSYSSTELCEIYNNVNAWRWDSRIGKKPPGFDELPFCNHHWWQRFFHRKTRYQLLLPILRHIEFLVPEKELHSQSSQGVAYTIEELKCLKK